MKIIICLLVLVFLTSCTDANVGQIEAFGRNAKVTCYSGGKPVFEEITTGKVAELKGGGWAFKTISGTFVQTFADCFVIYIDRTFSPPKEMEGTKE